MTGFSLFWLCAGLVMTILFWASLSLLFFSISQRRKLYIFMTALLTGLCYFLEQSVSLHASPAHRRPGSLVAASLFTAMPLWGFVTVIAGIIAVQVLLFLNMLRYERSQITAASIKEAIDSLPSGVCFYLDSGRLLMTNRKMHELYTAATGRLLANRSFPVGQMFSGPVQPGCELLTDSGSKVLRLPGNSAWAIGEKDLSYEKKTAHMLILDDVSELYAQNVSLRAMREKLLALNHRLTDYNREIVSLTAERELLDARVRLHDEMGADLLTIRRYLANGGTAQDRADIEARLRRNVRFLITGQSSQVRDEYEIILETAEKLGVRVSVAGELPQQEPQKHVAATAMHECLTNTLRHAHGDELTVSVAEQDNTYVITLSNNGDQPEGPVQEKGGLNSLRELTERIPGGSMEIIASPVFSVIIILPKEVPDAI